ncbi:integrase [Rhodoblastus acidophilus]|uniref:tyrosine-type recombinase/integrase n=1 Tax=Rhodoblastus acidophilus TaxID=1074 RepID=UPI002223F57D|nr:site-specific integrase [Rhodoblastus acidophilus]MCW2284947.1 integrase [Rhodoblastus acidophilus]MCW2333989.1 integrase [Rhodoblastus acidophilus]
MSLSDLQCKNAKPGPKVVKLSDGGGLQLWVTPDGAKRWRLAYRIAGKQKALAIGVYPSVGLKEAREARETAKKQIDAGQDPSVIKKIAKSTRTASLEATFDALAAELLEKKRREGKAAGTLEHFSWYMALARPVIGARPIAELSSAEVLAALRVVEARGRLETAKKMRASIGEVFRFAIATGRAENDPTSALKGALTAPVVKHRAAIIEPKAFGGLLRAIDGYAGAPETRAALELLALTFVRPGELRAAEWAEFDMDRALWTIPAEKMKMRRPHRVPLSPRALEILRDMQQMTGRGKYLFPSTRSATRCMSENTLNAALRRLGFEKDEMSAHGFRAAASSMLNECGLWHPDAIERQLAHEDADSIRKAYARADFWDERVRMMDWWASQCAEMRGGVQPKTECDAA